MIRRQFIVLLTATLASTTLGSSWPATVLAKDGDGGGGGGGGGGGDGGGGHGGGDNSGRGGGDDGGNGRGGDDGGQGRGRGGDDGGRGRGRGRGGDEDEPTRRGWGRTSSENAREAVSQGWALALSAVLPAVSRAVPGQVLEVDLRQSWSGQWRYEFLILTRDRRYQEVVVDARNSQILQIRRR
ncbi:PepSY domain-containing protein [Microvirga sp. 2MCAF35]|uniref:PepSY domain-containing protein n=1 Tax=Microvirga sp. 2MCAF35 TaxID=3232987 RepID=UPI003F991B57